jgi:hypothetical protein
MNAHTYPSLSTLESNDDDRLAAELRLGRLRAQVAIVRAIADEVDRIVRPSDIDGLGEQIITEVARLGCQLLESAGAHTRTSVPEASGVFEAEWLAQAASPWKSR